MQLLWSSFFKNLAKVNSIHINQHIFSHQTNYRNIVLHGFFDASNEAYATVIYLQIVYNNETFINLLTAKSKILPNKNLSVPRIALLFVLFYYQNWSPQ